MFPSKENEKYYFSRGILFVLLSYIGIQLINHYDFFFSLVSKGFTILKPFLFAFAIAYILNPLVKLVEKKLKFSRTLSTGVVYISLLAILSLGVYFVLPSLISNFSDLIKDIPNYISQLQSFIASLNIPSNIDIQKHLSSFSSAWLPSISNALMSYLNSAINTTFSFVTFIFDSIISLAASFYILVEKDNFFEFTRKLSLKIFKLEVHNTLSNIILGLHSNIGKYLLGKSIDSMIVGLLSFIGLSILKVKYAIVLSVFLTFTNMIPYIGPIGGAVLVAALNVFTNPSLAVAILIYQFIIQQIESFVLEPKIIGKSLDLSPFLTILAISIGGSLFSNKMLSICGMILGVPVMSIIKIYVKSFLNSDNNQSETQEEIA